MATMEIIYHRRVRLARDENDSGTGEGHIYEIYNAKLTECEE